MLNEVYGKAGFATQSPEWQKYFRSFHVSPSELAKEATEGKPKLLALYHQMYRSPVTEEQLLGEVKEKCAGKVVSGHDLDVY
jgi:ribonuclease BN (tRNA processing enzyme)